MASPAAVITDILTKISEKYGQAMPGSDQQADPAELRALVDECLAKLGHDKSTKYSDDAPYGLCPECGSPGKTRERSKNGYDTCANGHRYLSADSVYPEKFTDDEPPAGPAPISDQTAATPDSHAVDHLLSDAQREGSQFLSTLASKAITRYVRSGGAHLFTPQEMKSLEAECARSLAAADLLGRARVRIRQQALSAGPVAKFADSPTDFGGAITTPTVPLQPPLSALDYFKSLVPTLDVEPLAWLAEIEKQAFTMALATSTELLSKVQNEIATRIASGEYGWGQQAVSDLLTTAGVTPANPQYAEMVWRTNVKDALAKGTHEELSDPDVLPMFPVWRYSAVTGPDGKGDGRNRPSHLARHGKYYPSTVPFTKVRGEGPEDACNDRCDFIPIDKYDWADLQAQGAKIAAGF